MIIDTLENTDRYECVHPRFKAAFHFLRNTNLAALPDGRFEIDGDRLFVLTQTYQTKPLELPRAKPPPQTGISSGVKTPGLPY